MHFLRTNDAGKLRRQTSCWLSLGNKKTPQDFFILWSFSHFLGGCFFLGAAFRAGFFAAGFFFSLGSKWNSK